MSEVSKERRTMDVKRYHTIREEPGFTTVLFYGPCGGSITLRFKNKDFWEMENELRPRIDRVNVLIVNGDSYEAYCDFLKEFTITLDTLDVGLSFTERNAIFTIGSKKFKQVCAPRYDGFNHKPITASSGDEPIMASSGGLL